MTESMPTESPALSADLLYDVAAIRAAEQAALAVLPGGTLMQRAGAATAELSMSLLAQTEGPVLIVAGPGNNGGDALDAAARLRGHGRQVCVALLADPARLPADASAALQRARDSQVSFIAPADIHSAGRCDSWALAIDGLFGIGLTRAPQDEYRLTIEQLNALSCPVLAVDVPSGLDADTGALVGGGPAVRADHTITFIGNKPGLHTAHGRDCAGVVHVDTLGIDATLMAPARATLNTPARFGQVFAPRRHASHKGSFGDLTVIGGSSGMGGAVLLAARMGAQAGAGRVFAAFASAVPPFDPLHPELMCRDAQTIALDQGAVVAGPGLGMSRDAAGLLARVLGCALPLVLDADALNLVAAEPALQRKLAEPHAPVLLTPHPLEAARLLNIDVAAVQANRLDAAARLASSFNAYVILKGSGSVIASPSGELMINVSGNPALATAGSGDVLAGLCGALLAQHIPARETALAATWLHGYAADCLVADGIGPVGVTASELPVRIRAALNTLIARSERRS